MPPPARRPGRGPGQRRFVSTKQGFGADQTLVFVAACDSPVVYFPRQIQYQASAQVVTTTFAVPTATEDQWHQAWSVPTRITPALPVGEQQVLVQPINPVIVIDWFQALSEPVRIKPQVPVAEQVAQPLFESEQFPEIVSEDRWHQPWSVPSVLAKIGLLPANQWPTGLGQPPPNPTVSFSWFQALATPQDLRPRGLPTAEQQAAPYFETQQFPESVTESRWHQPWSLPSVLTRRQTPDFFAFLDWQPVAPAVEVITVDKWFAALSEPVRTPRRSSDFSFIAYSESQQFPETVTEDRWHQPWSEPVRTRWFPAAEQQALVQHEPQPIVSISWFAPLSEPVRLKIRLPEPEQTTFTSSPQPFVPFGWFAPFANPVRTPLRSAFFHDITYGEWQQFPETVSKDKWHQPWSEPVRFKQGLAAYEQQTLARVELWPIVAAEVISVDKWFIALSEPVRVRARDAFFQYNAQSESAQFPETVTESRWHEPWSEPVRTRWFPAADQQAVVLLPFPVVPFSWFRQLNEPVRIKPTFSPHGQQWIAYSESAQFPETVSIDRWLQQWSMPARLDKLGLSAAAQQAFIGLNPVAVATLPSFLGDLLATEYPDLAVFLGAKAQVSLTPVAFANVAIEELAKSATSTSVAVPKVRAAVSITILGRF